MPLLADRIPHPSIAHTTVNLWRVRELFEGSTPRLIVVGDSFSLGRADRLSMGILLQWPVGFSAICIPWHGSTTGVAAFLATPYYLGTQQAGHAYAGAANANTVSGKHHIGGDDLNALQTTNAPDAGDDWIGIPNGGGGREWFFNSGEFDPAGGSANRCGRLVLNAASSMADGVNGRSLWDTGDTVVMRPIFWCPADVGDIVASISLTPGTGITGTGEACDFATGARGMYSEGATPTTPTTPIASAFNSTAAEITITGNLGTAPDVGILRTDPGGDVFMPLYGLLVRRTSGTTSCYLQLLADSSWSYAGFATSAAPTLASPKQFVDAALTRYLDVTTIDRDQPWLVVLNIASENETAAAVRALVEAICERFRQAAASIGSPAPLFLLIGQPVHAVTGAPSDAAAAMANHEGMVAAALANPSDICYCGLGAYALFHAFHALPTVGAEAWLDAHGGNAFIASDGVHDFTTDAGCTSGAALDLYDGTDLHLAGQPEAEFFARMAWNLIAQEGDEPGRIQRTGRLDRTLRVGRR